MPLLPELKKAGHQKYGTLLWQTPLWFCQENGFKLTRAGAHPRGIHQHKHHNRCRGLHQLHICHRLQKSLQWGSLLRKHHSW